MQVIDDQQQRAVGRSLAQQCQGRVRHHQPAGGRPVTEAQGHAQRIPLRAIEPAKIAAKRKQKLVQSAKAHVLEFRARRPEHPNASCRGILFRSVKQRGLTDAGLPGKQQSSAVSRKLVQKGPDDSQILVAAHKLARLLRPTTTREDSGPGVRRSKFTRPYPHPVLEAATPDARSETSIKVIGLHQERR